VHVYNHLKEWRKNPHWSFSCCLALILPLVSLPGEISGFGGTNIVNNQLQTGDIERTTIAAALQESGAIDVTFDEGKGGDGISAEDQDNNHNDRHAQTGTVEMPTNVAAIEEREKVKASRHQGDGNPVETQNDIHTDTQTTSEKEYIPSSVATIQGMRGTVDVTDEEGEQDDGFLTAMQDENYQNVVYNAKKHHKATQTESSMVFFMANVVVHEPKETAHF